MKDEQYIVIGKGKGDRIYVEVCEGDFLVRESIQGYELKGFTRKEDLKLGNFDFVVFRSELLKGKDFPSGVAPTDQRFSC